MSHGLLVHPRPYRGESLTSYVIRTAYANQITVRELWSQFNSKFQKAHLKDVHQLDLDPHRVCDIPAFCRLTMTHQEDIETMTFRPLFQKFLDPSEMNSDKSRRDFCQNMLETTCRRYCPACIAKTPVYLILWQVKEVTLCPHHRVPLCGECRHCGRSLDLVHPALAKAECQHCGKGLGELRGIDLNTVQLETGIFETQERIMRDWAYLLDPNEEGVSLTVDSRRKSLAIVLLRVAQPEGEHMDPKHMTGMNKEYANRLVRFVRNESRPKRPTLPLMLSVLRNKVTFSELATLRPSTSFVQSILRTSETSTYRGPGACLSPWCKDFGTNRGMQSLTIIQNRFIGQLGGHFKDPYLCLGCSVRYGRDSERDEWAEADGLIEIGWCRVLPALNQGESRRQVSLRLGISSYHVTRIAGYFAAIGLLENRLAQKFTLAVKEDLSLLDYFEGFSDSGQLIYKLCRRYGWTQNQFWYVFYQPEVQQYLLIRRDRSRGPTKMPGEKASAYWTRRFYEELHSCLRDGAELDLETVANRIGCPTTTLVRYKLSRILSEQRYKQQIEQEDYYWNASREFVQECLDKHLRITVRDYLTHIDRTEKWMKKRFPDIVTWLKEQIPMSSQVHQQAVLEERMSQIQASVRKLQSQGKPYGIKEVAQDTGITATTISFYKELANAAREAAVSVDAGGKKGAGS